MDTPGLTDLKKTEIHQICAETEYLVDLLKVMANRDEWREWVIWICVVGLPLWWWWSYLQANILRSAVDWKYFRVAKKDVISFPDKFLVLCGPHLRKYKKKKIILIYYLLRGPKETYMYLPSPSFKSRVRHKVNFKWILTDMK